MTDKKQDSNKDFRAERLDVAGLALVNGNLQGRDALQKYKRLVMEAASITNDVATTCHIDWQAQGELVEGPQGPGSASQVWLHVQAQAHLPQICQRCLAEVDSALEVERSYRFVADEATAEAQDDAAEEDLLAISREFNLLELIEDELLMALPLVPMHEVCPVQPKMVASDADFEPDGEQKANPFAVLAALKTKKGS